MSFRCMKHRVGGDQESLDDVEVHAKRLACGEADWVGLRPGIIMSAAPAHCASRSIAWSGRSVRSSLLRSNVRTILEQVDAASWLCAAF